ncbi:restriction endonuclease subunit S [Enterobacter asburiae]|uniref:restriction endonuclease subunit S n=1 Tax=Enterobacter asburiae TaxID=61645 RepID=UPI0010CA4885|nr:restriction endonuclease subunit S [Enterobacter asburiae]MBS3043940.1 restriction endonuclease subunit S [Enterobacter asburiae]BBJ64698.1 restriction modification system DNA specificity domain-containing protein [Enterobacter asburiae]
MAKYKAYPEYKDSGVEWLGEIPTSWQMWKLSHAYEVIGSGTTPTSNNESYFQGDIPWVTTGELREKIIYDTDKKVKESTLQIFSALKIHPAGSVVIAMYGATIGRLGILGVDATTNQACCVMTKSKIINNQYLYYWLQAYRTDIIRLSSGGGQPNINQEKVSSLKVSAPVLNDQTLIVAFLDHETAKIDNLIEKQQQLIELLKEKRQAVISHAVTKGLNPDVPMKDSGVEWLGEVPEHWRVSRIKNYAKIESGHTPSRTKPEYWVSCNIPWVSLNDSKQLKEVDYIEDTFYKISELGMANSSAHLLPARAVVFTRDASIGLSAITTKSMAVSQHLIAWVCDEKFIIPEFLLLVFYAMEKEFERYTFGATIKTIGMDNVRGLKSTFPPIEEQRNLIDWAFNKIEKIKSSINRVEDMLSLLQERRTALISAAVTGKIDVRDWVATDTQDVEEPQEATA